MVALVIGALIAAGVALVCTAFAAIRRDARADRVEQARRAHPTGR